MTSEKQEIRRSLVIVCVGLATRLLMSFLIEPTWSGGDGDYYLGVARSLLDGGAFSFADHPTFAHPPGYPAFLAGVLGMGGDVATVFILQSGLTVGVALFTHWRMPEGYWVAIAIVACPFFVAVEWMLLGETLLIALLWSSWLLFTFPRGRWDLVAAGILLGCAALVRDVVVFLPLFAIPLAFAISREVGKRALILASAACLTVTPWLARNASHGVAGLSEGRMGFNLWVGTWERNGDWMLKGIQGGDYPAYAFRDNEADLRAALPTIDNDTFRAAAFDRMKTDPGFVVSSWAIRYPRLWLSTRTDQSAFRVERGSPLWMAAKSGFYALNLSILVLGFLGLVQARRRWPLAIPVAYLALIYIPFHNTEARYSLPAIPFLIVSAVKWLRPKARARLSRGFLWSARN